MAYRMDRMVGPDGEWRSEDAEAEVTPDRLRDDRPSEREAFIRRCLNAAVNLYGVLTYSEFIDLYNGYAREHPRPISDTLTKDELQDFVIEHLDDGEDAAGESFECFFDRSDAWFGNWYIEKAGEDLLVQIELVTSEIDGTPRHPGDTDKEIDQHIAKARSRFLDVPKKILPEREFLEYEEPMYSEPTPEADEVAKFLSEEYGISSDDAETDVWGVQGHLRFNGATQTLILEYIRDNCDYEPENWDAMERLIRATGPLVGVTRTWYFRGHTGSELAKLGLLPRVEREDIYDVFGLDDDDDVSRECDDDYLDSDDDCGESVRLEDLPPAQYTGPIDFKFVKDAAKRERKLFEYEGVRIVTDDFIRREVMCELKSAETAKTARWLGIRLDDEPPAVRQRVEDIAACFSATTDDRHGEPVIRRIDRRRDELVDDIDRRALDYFLNARFTWLEILAVKSGVGYKCRDLLTGEDLFLMSKSVAAGDVRGAVIFTPISPIGDVYLSLGVVQPVLFSEPQTVLKSVLDDLKIPDERPIRLSSADHARFTAETIRRIHEHGDLGATTIRKC